MDAQGNTTRMCMLALSATQKQNKTKNWLLPKCGPTRELISNCSTSIQQNTTVVKMDRREPWYQHGWISHHYTHSFSQQALTNMSPLCQGGVLGSKNIPFNRWYPCPSGGREKRNHHQVTHTAWQTMLNPIEKHQARRSQVGRRCYSSFKQWSGKAKSHIGHASYFKLSGRCTRIHFITLYTVF